MSIEPPTLTTPPPPAQAKYKSVPTCVEVTKRVPRLPKFRSGNEETPIADMFTGCTFQRIPDWPRVSLEISAWRNEPGNTAYPADVGRGNIKARERFGSFDPAEDDPADDVEVGEKTKWKIQDKDTCILLVLDENALLRLLYEDSDKPNPRSEECRGPMRELAKSFYDAVQPR